MKKRYILLLVLITFKCFSQSGWTYYGISGDQSDHVSALLSSQFVGEAYIGGDTNKIWKTTNNGQTWVFQQLENGSVEMSITYKLSPTLDNSVTELLWTCGTLGRIHHSSNGGLNWSLQTSGATTTLYSIHFATLQKGWACGNLGTLVATTNGGSSWFPQTSGTTTRLMAICFYDANTGWCTGLNVAGGAPILKTTNGGTTWTTLLNIGTGISLYGMYFINENTGYCCGNSGINGKLFKTTNGGLNWSDQYWIPSGGVLRSLYFTSNNDTGYCAGAQDFLANTGRILKTTNGGANWFSQTLPANTKDINSISFINGTRGIAAGRTGTVLITTSGGEPIGIRPISNEVPSGFSLSQNYPNPFNPGSKFKVQISKLSRVKIIVYDAVGREVETLINEELRPGTYEVDWDGSRFASGVYYYKLIAGDFAETKKMVLIK